MSEQSQSGSIVIDKWTNLYAVPADHPDPEALRSRLDGCVSGDVLDSCRRRLAQLLDVSSKEVWLIREIQIDMAVDAGSAGLWQTADRWAEGLAQEIRRSLEAGANGASLLRFPDRATYIAQWARDMAAGHAWGKWYYTEFASLRVLPAGAAIAEGLLREPDQTEQVILNLYGAGTLASVLSVLGASSAERVLRACLPASALDRAGEVRWMPRLLSLWNLVSLSHNGAFQHDGLRLFAATRAEWPDENAAGLYDGIKGMLQLARVLQAIPTLDACLGFLRAAAAGDFAQAQRCAPPGVDATLRCVFDFAARQAGVDPGWASLVAAVLRPGDEGAEREGHSFLSDCAGIFLLGPSFVALGMHEALEAAAQTCEDPAAAAPVLRHMAAMFCLGAGRAASSICDEAVRLFSGMGAGVSPVDMHAIVEAAATTKSAEAFLAESETDEEERATADDPYFRVSAVFPELDFGAGRNAVWARMAHRVLRHFAARRLGFARSSPEYLYGNFLAGAGDVRVTANTVEVRLPQSPLCLVLRISGAYCSYELPWRKGAEVCLRAPSE